MKAERIQTKPTNLPGWNFRSQMAVEREFESDSNLEALQLATRLAEAFADAANCDKWPKEQVVGTEYRIQDGRLTVKVFALETYLLDAEVQLIDIAAFLNDLFATSSESIGETLISTAA